MTNENIKVVLLGSTGVGKTCITIRFVKSSFENDQHPTIGAAYMTKKMVYKNQTLIFEIWDTAGQERYKSIMPLYYRNADAIIIVFDLTREDSFHEAAEWLQRVTQTGRRDSMPIILVGNKKDQIGREIDHVSIQQFVYDHNLTYFEASAKTGDNVNDIFSWIASQLHTSIEEQMFSVPVTNDYKCVSGNSCC